MHIIAKQNFARSRLALIRQALATMNKHWQRNSTTTSGEKSRKNENKRNKRFFDEQSVQVAKGVPTSSRKKGQTDDVFCLELDVMIKYQLANRM